MRLQDERNALDRRRIRAFAPFGEALLKEFLRVGKSRIALASLALAAEIVREQLAVRGLREHARKSEFAHAARAGKKQSVRNALAAQGAAKHRHDAFVSKKFRKAHGLPPLLSGVASCALGEQRLNRSQNLRRDLLGQAHEVAHRVEALNRRPRRT